MNFENEPSIKSISRYEMCLYAVASINKRRVKSWRKAGSRPSSHRANKIVETLSWKKHRRPGLSSEQGAEVQAYYQMWGSAQPPDKILQRNYELNGYCRFKFSGCLVSSFANSCYWFTIRARRCGVWSFHLTPDNIASFLFDVNRTTKSSL